MRIKELREEKEFLQLDIARKMNISKNCISDWERERSQPNIEQLKELADIFDCSIDYLVGRENDFGVVVRQPGSSNDALTAEEIELISLFRQLIPTMQARLIGYVYGLLEKQKSM